MWKFIMRTLLSVGKWGNGKHDTYVPQYKGNWKNRGTDHNEIWEWVEKVPRNRPFFLNVFVLEGDYIITLGWHPKPNAVESVECIDKKDMEIALELLEAYYGTLGNVVRSMEGQ